MEPWDQGRRVREDECPWGSGYGHALHPGIIRIVEIAKHGLSMEPAFSDDKMATRRRISTSPPDCLRSAFTGRSHSS